MEPMTGSPHSNRVSHIAIQLGGTMTETNSESDLIEHAKHDPDAFGQLYRMHYAAIAGYLLRRVGDETNAEDLAAETFIAAFKAIKKYRDTGSPFRAWLYRIAANRANMWSRTQRRILIPAAAMTDEPDADSQANIHAALETLPSKMRSVVSLTYWTPMSTAQVAQTLGIAEGTVKSRLARARQAIKHEIERQVTQEGGTR
jgi:RNA polymerase sigma-70 factor (ECF subfamily)